MEACSLVRSKLRAVWLRFLILDNLLTYLLHTLKVFYVNLYVHSLVDKLKGV